MSQDDNQIPINSDTSIQALSEATLIKYQKQSLQEITQEAPPQKTYSKSLPVIEEEESPEILRSDQVEKSSSLSVPMDDEEKNLNDIREGFEEQDQVKKA